MPTWVRYDDSGKKWEYSTNQGGAWNDIVENPIHEIVIFNEIAAPVVSAAGTCKLYFDSTAKVLKISEDNGAYAEVAKV